jgi:hypothetical protein
MEAMLKASNSSPVILSRQGRRTDTRKGGKSTVHKPRLFLENSIAYSETMADAAVQYGS